MLHTWSHDLELQSPVNTAGMLPLITFFIYHSELSSHAPVVEWCSLKGTYNNRLLWMRWLARWRCFLHLCVIWRQAESKGVIKKLDQNQQTSRMHIYPELVYVSKPANMDGKRDAKLWWIQLRVNLSLCQLSSLHVRAQMRAWRARQWWTYVSNLYTINNRMFMTFSAAALGLIIRPSGGHSF